MPDYVVAGTGSRSLQVADKATKRRAWDLTVDGLQQHRAERGDRLVVMSGLAEGYDSCIAKAALHLGLRLWAAIPNRGYLGHYWGRASLTGTDRLAEAREIVTRAEQVTYVMEDVHGARGLYLNGVHSNFVRNSFMVQNAAEFLVWDPTSKGTAHCLAQVKKAGLRYEVLSPELATLPL